MATDLGTLRVRKQQFVRNEICDAAIDLFAAKGFDETTIEEVAEAAGVSRRSFFRYFSSKDDLMAQGVESYGAYLAEAIQACPATHSHIGVVREVVLDVAKHAVAYPRTRKIMEIADRSAVARAAQVSRYADVQDRVAGAFALRCTNLDDKLLPKLLAFLTLSTLDLALRLWFKEDIEDISATIERIFAALGQLSTQFNQPVA